MQQLIIGGLDGMPESVAKVEKGANPCLAFICRNDGCFQSDIPPDDVGSRGFVERQESLPVTGQDIGKIASFTTRSRTLNHRMFHDLGPAGPQIAGWQGVQERGVNYDQRWLQKCSYEILSGRVV